MTQEERELLLKDLCTRLPYGVKIPYNNQACKLISMNGDDGSVLLLGEDGFTKPEFDDGLFIPIEKIKPYLRPPTSMTEEELREFQDIEETCQASFYPTYCHTLVDWLDKKNDCLSKDWW